MRVADLGGRAILVVPGADDRGVDIAEASGGKFSPDVQGLYGEWDALRAFVADLDLSTVATAAFDLVSPATCDQVSSASTRCPIGHDLSDRTLQFAAGGQFSRGKSHRGFAPLGPWVVTTDELDDPDDLALGNAIDGATVQDARTGDLVFGVPQLVAELSAVVPMLPGDIVFTGTPGGVGVSRRPPRFLRPGETIESWVEGIGTIRTCFTAPVGGRDAG